MIIDIKRRTMGNITARTKLDTGEEIGVTFDKTPNRKFSYWLNGKRVLPFGAKSPTAKFLPVYKDLTGAIIYYEERK